MRVSAISVQSSNYVNKMPLRKINREKIDLPEQNLNRKDVPQEDSVAFKSNKGALIGILGGAVTGLAIAAVVVATGGAAAVPALTVLGAGAGAGAQVGGITGGLISGKENP